MSNAVYRAFNRGEIFSTTVHAQPAISLSSGSAGWSGSTILGTNALSLYGGVRSRSDVSSGSLDLQVYPIDEVDTHSIDKVIGVPGQYPQTGSANLVYVSDDEQPSENAVTDTRWYEEHWGAINILSDWYHSHFHDHYPALDELPPVISLLSVPEMFYGRQVATGSIMITNHAWDQPQNNNMLVQTFVPNTFFPTGTRYYVDDGRGRLFDVPLALVGDWKTAWMSGDAVQVGVVFYNEGLIVFTDSDTRWHQEFLAQSFNTVQGDDSTVKFEFKGSTIMQSVVLMCRMGAGDVNCSNNPTFMAPSGSANFSVTDGTTYITAVGIYNRERQLVAVAKLAQPIRKREADSLDVRLRLDV